MLDDVRQALSAGVTVVQYRDKGNGRKPTAEIARPMLHACHRAGALFIVNDDVELASAIGADGVHVGQGDGSAALARERLGRATFVGVSVASIEELREAVQDGADYVAASPVFSTPTKVDAGPGIGIEGVKSLRVATHLPLAVIGGVNASNVADLARAGADLFCAISASLAEGTVERNVRALSERFAAARAPVTKA